MIQLSTYFESLIWDCNVLYRTGLAIFQFVLFLNPLFTTPSRTTRSKYYDSST
jgi:hypothetical protein